MNKLLVDTVLPWAGTVVGTVVLPWLALELKKFVAAKTKNEKLRGILDRLADAAVDVVRDVSATTYKELVARNADGKISSEDRSLLRALAVSKLRSVGASELKDLASVSGLGDDAVTTRLLGMVEKAVDDMNLARVAAANAVPVASVAKV